MAKDSSKGCYWGVGTCGNRIAWGLVAVCVVVGAAFWVPGVMGVKKCISLHTQCACSPTAGGGTVCLNRTQPSEAPRARACYEQYLICMRRPAVVWALGWLFLVGLSWVPCCYFCCCSSSPKQASAAAAAAAPGVLYGVQMAPVTGVPPYSNGQYSAPPNSNGQYGVPSHYAAGQLPPASAHSLAPPHSVPAAPAAAAAAAAPGLLAPAGSVVLLPQSSGQYNLYQQPSGQYNLYQQSSGQYNLHQQPSGQYNLYQQPSFDHNLQVHRY